MPEPEIARRCHACGASIRDHAAFCPECGKEQKITAELNAADSQETQATTIVETTPLTDKPIPTQQLTKERSADGVVKQQPPAPASLPKKSTAGTHLVAGARDKVHRATDLAKNVGGDVVQRGHKLREMSSVVLDEASYDPSLRFVLVAAGLFLLFLVMVLVNRFIV